MKHVIILVNGIQVKNFIFKCYKNKINIEEIEYIDDNNLKIKINEEDLEKIYNVKSYFEIKTIKYYGLKKLKRFIKNNYVMIFIYLMGISLIYLLTNIIVDVEVIHEDKEIRRLITNQLNNYHLETLTFKKNYQELNNIKKKIINNLKDKIEWLEIENVGMKYIIKVEERIVNEPKTNSFICNVVASKDAVITSIKTHEGIENVFLNDYVKEGDILISSEIKFNEDIKNKVCASGEVKGNVWYKVAVTIPFNYEEKQYTGKKRYNLNYEIYNKDHSIFRTKFKKYDVKQKKLFKIFNFKLNFEIEKEYKIISKVYNEEEALNKGIDASIKSILLKTNNKGTIIAQKVLKKSINDSKMNIELFVIVNEVISKQEIIKE